MMLPIFSGWELIRESHLLLSLSKARKDILGMVYEDPYRLWAETIAHLSKTSLLHVSLV